MALPVKETAQGPVAPFELPKLPAPNVDKTLTRYLDAIRAYTPQDQFEATSKIVENFRQDRQTIEAIETMLKEKAEKEENWAYDWWLHDMYLNNPLPLPVVSNPAWVFPRQDFRSRDQMISFTAELVRGMGDFKISLENGTANLEKDSKLCMKQYERILTSYRVPGLDKDELKVWDVKLVRDEEHILVLARNYTYKMFIKHNGKWLTTEELARTLLAIFNDALDRPVNPTEECVSLLTSDHRQTYARTRALLLQDKTNATSMSEIEGCLFVVCLDEMSHNCSDHDRSQKEMFRQILTAGGERFNAKNRWFDKTVQIIVSEDGVCGMNYEHTTSEGVAVVTLVQSIFANLKSNDDKIISVESVKQFYSRLDWNLSPEVKQILSKSAENINKLDEDTDIEVFRFKDFGKNFMKDCNCSPDSFVQMSMQLTYYRLHGSLCATYESASLRRFHQGRVDSIRASHSVAKDWVRTMDDENVSNEERQRFFLEAIAMQTRIMKENIFGEGLDIPMLGIRMACTELWPGRNFEIFTDPNFKTAYHFKLSTSQVPVSLPYSYMGYGAVVPDGYGVSYNLHNDVIIFCVASFFSCADTRSIRFSHALQKSLRDIREIFMATKEAEKSAEIPTDNSQPAQNSTETKTDIDSRKEDGKASSDNVTNGSN